MASNTPRPRAVWQNAGAFVSAEVDWGDLRVVIFTADCNPAVDKQVERLDEGFNSSTTQCAI